MIYLLPLLKVRSTSPPIIEFSLDLQPGLDFQAFIRHKFGLPINARAGSERGSFILVVSFGRCKSKLSPLLVGHILQAVLDGRALDFWVSLLQDRVFSFVVSSKQVGF